MSAREDSIWLEIGFPPMRFSGDRGTFSALLHLRNGRMVTVAVVVSHQFSVFFVSIALQCLVC